MEESPVALAEDQARTLSVNDVTSLVNLFNTMLTAVEARIVARLDSYNADMTVKFAVLEGELGKLKLKVDTHLAEEHDEEVRNDARVKPLKTGLNWFVFHWRDIVLFIIGFVALLGFLGDALLHYLFSPGL